MAGWSAGWWERNSEEFDGAELGGRGDEVAVGIAGGGEFGLLEGGVEEGDGGGDLVAISEAAGLVAEVEGVEIGIGGGCGEGRPVLGGGGELFLRFEGFGFGPVLRVIEWGRGEARVEEGVGEVVVLIEEENAVGIMGLDDGGEGFGARDGLWNK